MIFQNLNGNFFFVFLSFDFNLGDLNISFPLNDILLIFILSPLLTSTIRFSLFEPIESGLVIRLTVVFR